MCDYSLEAVDSRPAEVGDQLESSWVNGHTIGLVSPAHGNRLTCLLKQGTKLVLSNLPSTLRKEYGLEEFEEVIYRRLNVAGDYHRDGFVFSNGKSILLQKLGEGLKAHVCDIPQRKQGPAKFVPWSGHRGEAAVIQAQPVGAVVAGVNRASSSDPEVSARR